MNYYWVFIQIIKGLERETNYSFWLYPDGGILCHGPRLKLKIRAVLRSRNVFFGCQRSASTHTNAVLGLSAPAS